MTDTAEGCLRWVYTLREAGQSPTASALTDRVGVAKSTMSVTIRCLLERGLLATSITESGSISLTPAGAAEALWMIRRHRLLELFLQKALGYGWDTVHAEACRLEHAVSHELVERMATMLGDPFADPHGAPIPRAGAPLLEPALPCLPDLAVGQRAVLRRVRVREAAMLRYLADIGLCLLAEVEIVEKAPFDGPVSVRVGGSERALGHELSRGLRAQPIEVHSGAEGSGGDVLAA